jgi:hypothetical protein
MSRMAFETEVERQERNYQEELRWCICCGMQADAVRVAIGYCAYMDSIRYGICRQCKDTEKASDAIVKAQRLVFRFCRRPTPEEDQRMCDEAVMYAFADGILRREDFQQQ